MDFIIGLPISFGFSVIMVAVDRILKYAHHSFKIWLYSQEEVASLTLLSSRDFSNQSFQIEIKCLQVNFGNTYSGCRGTTLAISSSTHPQTDDQSETMNKCIELHLRCLTFEYPKSWYKAMPWAELWYNSSFHTSVGISPFQIVHGRPPPSLTGHEW